MLFPTFLFNKKDVRIATGMCFGKIIKLKQIDGKTTYTNFKKLSYFENKPCSGRPKKFAKPQST